ncbi:TonB-dependent receptor [Tenacibaculum xiamenense]|uniref:TonB-dependent receptor n=1 Tax=Tenacibaculum xiamenense TaxID=1261553 RepID=UPI00389424CD
MTNKSLSYLFCVFFCAISYAQKTQSITLKIIDSNSKKEIPFAHVSIGDKHAYAKSDGRVFLSNIPYGSQKVMVTHVGYETLKRNISIPNEKEIILALTLNNATLSEVVISQNPRKTMSKFSAITSEIDNNFLEKNRDNSLMQTLRDIPGVNAITIGSGQSKPTIRGLGFNRIVVVENGIKHEAQQWGADHGLEIDQYNIEDIEVTKGASSLLYGSDAISGVINLKNNTIPDINSFSGEINVTNRSNNDFYGISVGIKQRYNQWFYKARVTLEDYGDFKVPTDRINYDNYIFNLHKNYLRNTAGYNHNLGFSLGYVNENITSITTFSNINAKNGFFANAHGLEVRSSKIDYDHDNRDIDLPFHKVNHFKITNNTSFSFENNILDLELGYQKNHREEHSEPVAHGYMPAPNNSMERLFEKSTYTLNIKDRISCFENHKITTGINLEYQDNNISGWGFLIPAYDRFTIGGFVYDQVKLNDNLYVDGGIRYDYGSIKTQPYYEWFYTPVTDQNGNTTQQKLQRAEKRNLSFSSFSASAGISYTKESTSYKINFGKSFRMPLANELASDGVNYHMYRYEEGSLDLDPESSYQIDAEFKTTFNNMDFQITPFVNYFDNYIYLSPSSEYYQTLQKYQYQQSKVFRYGGEILAHYRPINSITLSGSIEYVKAKQLSGRKKNFTLPFSPPLTGVVSVEYNLKPWSYFKEMNLFASGRFASDQNEIVPPEKPTKGYSLFSLGLRTNVLAFSKTNPLKIQGKINNLFNRKAFDHTSFYRLIEVPQPGRNFSITLIQTF